jgi:DNA-binding transcriptional regulator YiaG
MDAGLRIKELASLIGVTEDTVINWEMRGIKPSKCNLDRTEAIFAQLELAELKIMTKKF